MAEPLLEDSPGIDRIRLVDATEPTGTALAPIPRFPQEIVDAILDEVGEDTDVLRQCRLASHAMSISARPRMHRKIVITNAQQCQNFYRLCCDTEDIPGLVRELHLQGDERLHPDAEDDIIDVVWTHEPSLPAVLARLRHIQRLHLAFIFWNHVASWLFSNNLHFLSLRGIWFEAMGEVASFMKKAPHLQHVEIRDWLYFEKIFWVRVQAAAQRESSSSESSIENLSLINYSDFILQTAVFTGVLIPFSYRHLKKLSIHLPTAFDCVIIEEMVYSSRGPLEELTLTAPRRCFGVATEVADAWSGGWVDHIPTSPVLPSRLPLRVLRFQMVDRNDPKDSAATDPQQILMWITRFLAKETGTIDLERITIEVILTDPVSLCFNSEVWHDWDTVLSRSNVPSLNSVQVTLRALLDRPDLIPQSTLRLEDLRKHIIGGMPQLNSKGVLCVDAPTIAHRLPEENTGLCK